MYFSQLASVYKQLMTACGCAIYFSGGGELGERLKDRDIDLVLVGDWDLGASLYEFHHGGSTKGVALYGEGQLQAKIVNLVIQ